MTYEELIQKLSAVSEEEEEALQGKNPPYEDAPYIDWEQESAQVLLGNLYATWLTPNISLNRHSRYEYIGTHNHPWYEMMYVCSGTLTHIVEGHKITIRKGQTLLILPDTRHSIEPAGEKDIALNLMLKKEFFLTDFFGKTPSENVLYSYILHHIYTQSKKYKYLLFPSQNSRRTSMYFMEMMMEYFEPQAKSSQILDHFVHLLFHELANVYSAKILEDTKSDNNLVPAILRYMENNYKTCTLNETAEYFHFSSAYITRLLKNATGFTFVQLLQEIRLNRAATMLLCTNFNTARISRECGYENISFFYKKFQSKFQMSPAQYRENGV